MEWLTQAAAQGDPEALGELLCLNLPRLRAYVRRQAGPLVSLKEAHSDIVQSVCREVLNNGEAFQHPNRNAFRRWLYVTAQRKLTNKHAWWTSAKREGIAQPNPAEDQETLDLIRDPNSLDPSSQAELKSEIQKLQAAITALPPDYRQVIFLARIAEYSHEEISEVIGRPPGATRMLLHRALARLSSVLVKDQPS